MTVSKFFETFLGDNAEFGLDEFNRRMERKDIVLDPWKFNELIGFNERWLKSLVPVKGVPFLSQTRH